MALFPTVISRSLTIADAGLTLDLALGGTTIVLCTISTNITINGITTTGGINVDGAVVVLQNVTGASTLSFAHNVGTPSTSGFLNTGLTTVSGGVGYGAVMWRYFATANRWLQLGGTI